MYVYMCWFKIRKGMMIQIWTWHHTPNEEDSQHVLRMGGKALWRTDKAQYAAFRRIQNWGPSEFHGIGFNRNKMGFNFNNINQSINQSIYIYICMI